MAFGCLRVRWLACHPTVGVAAPWLAQPESQIGEEKSGDTSDEEGKAPGADASNGAKARDFAANGESKRQPNQRASRPAAHNLRAFLAWVVIAEQRSARRVIACFAYANCGASDKQGRDVDCQARDEGGDAPETDPKGNDVLANAAVCPIAQRQRADGIDGEKGRG